LLLLIFFDPHRPVVAVRVAVQRAVAVQLVAQGGQ